MSDFFHTSCPVTCRMICDCDFGPKPTRAHRRMIAALEDFMENPWVVRDEGTVQVLVPRLVPLEEGGEEVADAKKRAELQKKVSESSKAAEEYARKVEAGKAPDVSEETATDIAQEDQGTSIFFCRICFSGEKEGCKKAIDMLSCKLCNKKYHGSCLDVWGQYRDLFHWSSWACPSCRICEVCRRAGDPNKLMYCKRCDDAYHCYCLQPPHRNVSHGPFLCPKHTKCHSCGSNVSGSGHSTRWFLSCTCCDACGRLFVKGNYCPVCLKVYRDSEMTPMVCCDACQQWTHCVCDDISDEKYQQFQSDENLSYTCRACRGDCYQVKDAEDAVQELWKRRDEADSRLIASLRSAAGLPSEEKISSSPYSEDDNKNGPVVMKNDSKGSLKPSVKGLAGKTSKSSKKYAKNSPQSFSMNKKHSKKGYRVQSSGLTEEIHQGNEKQQDAKLLNSSIENKLLVHQEETKKSVKKAAVNNVSGAHTVNIRSNKTDGLHLEEGAKSMRKDKTSKGNELAIYLPAKNKTSPISEAPPSCHRDRDFCAVKGAKVNHATRTPGSNHEEREKNLVKFKYVSGTHGKCRTKVAKASEVTTPRPIKSKKISSKEKVPSSKQSVDPSNTIQPRFQDASKLRPSKSASDLKPLPKHKLKSPSFKQQSSWAYQGVKENSVARGQRSKRKRASLEKIVSNEENDSSAQVNEENPIDEVMDANLLDLGNNAIEKRFDTSAQANEEKLKDVMDANWIVKKLGKGAIGKRVEVHQSSDNSWIKGGVSDVIEECSLLVHLDDGKSGTVDLNKQQVRLIAKKKRTKVILGEIKLL